MLSENGGKSDGSGSPAPGAAGDGDGREYGAFLLANVDLDGGANSWTGSEDPDTARGNGGNDALRGLGGADELRGGTGNDTLDAGSGADSMYGWTGNDSAIFTDTGAYFYGGPGEDSVVFAGTGFSGSLDTLGTLRDVETLSFSQSGNTILDLTVAQVAAAAGGRNTLAIGASPGASVTVHLSPEWGRSADGWGELAVGGTYTATHGGRLVTLRLLDGVHSLVTRDTGVEWRGGDGGDTFSGLDGADTLRGAGGNDILSGLEDYAAPGSGDSDVLWGGSGNDTLYGNGDHLLGGIGDDMLHARGAEGDTVHGWTGNDHVTFLNSNVHFNGGSGEDTAVFSGPAFSGRLSALGQLRQTEFLSFSQPDNLLTVSAADVVRVTDDRNSLGIGVTGAGAVTVALESGWVDTGNGIYTAVDGESTAVLRITGGTVTSSPSGGLNFSGDNGDNSQSGTDAPDTLRGHGGNDTLLGGDMADVLRGGTGDDVLDAGAGADIVYGWTGNDSITFTDAGVHCLGGPGDDTLVFAGSGFSGRLGSLAWHLGGIEVLSFSQSGNFLDGITAAEVRALTDARNTLVLDAADGVGLLAVLAPGWESAGAGVYTALLDGSVITLRHSGGVGIGVAGSAGLDFFGSSMDERYVGTTGGYTLRGGDGNDTLAPGTYGIGLIQGDGGDDSLYGGVREDTLHGGTGDDTLVGGPGAGEFQGGDGNDSISGGVDADVIDGGEGNDSILGGGGADTIRGGGGADTIHAALGAISLHGDEGNDSLRAEEPNQGVVVVGGAGNDTLFAIGFLDELRGGAGDDRLGILEGNASMYGADGDDYFTLPDSMRPQVLIEGGAGEDTVAFPVTGFSGSMDALGILRDIEVLAFLQSGNTISDLTAAQVAAMTDGRNALAIEAGGGTVTLAAGWVDTGNGIYTAVHEGQTVTLRVSAGVVDVSGTGVVFNGGDGNDYRAGSPGADALSGGGGNDTLLGFDGKDVLRGGTGDDFLYAGTGADTVYGWTGNDSLVFADAGVFIDAGPDSDTVVFSETGFSGSLDALGTLRSVETLSFEQSGNTISDLTAAQVASVTDGRNALTIEAGGGTVTLAAGWTGTVDGTWTALSGGEAVTLTVTGAATLAGAGGEADPGGELAWLLGGNGDEASGGAGAEVPSAGVPVPDADDSPLIA